MLAFSTPLGEVSSASHQGKSFPRDRKRLEYRQQNKSHKFTRVADMGVSGDGQS